MFVGSKNALVAGANAAAYSSAKAASLHLARCLAEEGGPHGIRVNTVNPDAVIQGSGIWSSDWKTERASTYGVTKTSSRASIAAGRSWGSASIRKTWPRRLHSSPALARPSPPETSSTSTAASPPRIRDERAGRRRALPPALAAGTRRRRSAPSRRSRTSRSSSSPARRTRSWARTAPASRRSSRSSPACILPDAGSVLVNGAEVVLDGPADARDAGIAVIYQEPTLFPDLTVVENIFIGRQPLARGRRIDRHAMRAQVRRSSSGSASASTPAESRAASRSPSSSSSRSARRSRSTPG